MHDRSKSFRFKKRSGQIPQGGRVAVKGDNARRDGVRLLTQRSGGKGVRDSLAGEAGGSE